MDDIEVILNAQPASGATPPNPDAEVERLRTLIEKQPGCLMRVGFDGLLLAVNDAALQMLGTRELADALGRNLTEWILPDHRGHWHRFAGVVRDAGSGSAECHMVDLEGSEHPVLLQGVWLADHPDGVASLIVAVRDLSATRRIEEALLEHAGLRQALDDAQQRLQQVLAEQEVLRSASEECEAGYQQLLVERAKMQALAEEHHLALLLKEREGRRALEELQRELDEARAGSRRLEASLAEMEPARQQLLIAHAAERQRLEEALTQERERAAAAAFEGLEQLGALQREAESAVAEQRRLEDLLEEHEGHRRRLADQHSAELADAGRNLADAERSLAGAKLEAADALKALADQHSAELADAGRNLADAERSLASARLEAADALKAVADERVALQSLDASVRSLEPLAAAGRLALDVGRELRGCLAAVDARAKDLLARCEETSADRRQIETLLVDVGQAASLTRQIVHGATDPVECPARPDTDDQSPVSGRSL